MHILQRVDGFSCVSVEVKKLFAAACVTSDDRSSRDKDSIAWLTSQATKLQPGNGRAG